MLDAHSQLAIPPETGFLLEACGLPAGDAEALLALVTGYESWPDFHLDAVGLGEAMRALDPFTVPAGLRVFYETYARRFAKARWGDKTPSYGPHALAIETLLPEARFVHIIRDGRDVALSVRPLWFAPGPTVEDAARDWAGRIERTRAACARCGHVIEVRYEDLVTAPEAALRRVCAFLDLPFEPRMLAWHENALSRLREHEGRLDREGRVRLTKQQRLDQQRRVAGPADRSRLYRWRLEMSADEQRRFHDVAGGMLRTLGYEVP